MRGHVFVVNEETLPLHLEHQFVGVSAGKRDTYISLLADTLRVKQDDFVFFYIESKGIHKGRFFGVFQAVDNVVYHLQGRDAFKPNLPVKLIYRKRIKPFRVYPQGVLEWVALDKLPTYSRDLLWTLIYRKMKGKRGNTMLFPWEVKKLISLIQDKNNGQWLSGEHFTFDKSKYVITRGTQTYTHAIGNPVQLSLKEIRKAETYLQAYILQQLSIGDNTFLPKIFGKNIVWIGNEVFAGSGMQKIDILTVEKIDETEYFYRIIELKHPKVKSGSGLQIAPRQLEYYVQWAREDIGGHIPEGRQFNIKPILFVLTQQLNSIPTDVVTAMQRLRSISDSPEIWEMDYAGQVNKVL